MKLVFVGGNPELVRPGGMMAYTMNLITYYVKKNVRVSLIAPSTELNKTYPFQLIPICNKKDVSSVEAMFNLFQKKRKIKLSSDCIIHAQRSDEMFPFVLFYKKNCKVLTLHGAHVKNVYKKKGKVVGTFYNLIERFVLKRVDKLISVSEENKNYFINKYPFIKNKIVVIPIGIDLNIFKPLNKNHCREKYGLERSDEIILYVGRFEKEKRIEIIIEVFNQISKDKKYSNVKLLLVGAGKEKTKINNYARKNPNIIIKGPMANSEIPEIINCSDVLILSSLYEGLPTIVLESLACGVPVVSTDVGDVNKVVIDGKTGFIVKIGDETKMVDMIKGILLENTIQKINCIEIAKNYSIDKIAERLMGEYNELLIKKSAK